ncbi:Hypothetical predicted protein [Pelobates cultripes]|uniref:Uncharacterized protein n=1 Tax=Pelobates cultripes TaxID=61616 RepID=A0AAD1TA62_PELCU|nr:Hypothetical predicted protein [Pelobates cultripes]
MDSGDDDTIKRPYGPCFFYNQDQAVTSEEENSMISRDSDANERSYSPCFPYNLRQSVTSENDNTTESFSEESSKHRAGKKTYWCSYNNCITMETDRVSLLLGD